MAIVAAKALPPRGRIEYWRDATSRQPVSGILTAFQVFGFVDPGDACFHFRHATQPCGRWRRLIRAQLHEHRHREPSAE
jgi:hypothetical protein